MLREIIIRYRDVEGPATRAIFNGADLAEYAYHALELVNGTPDREALVIIPLDARRMPLGHLRVDGLAHAVIMDVQTAIGTVLRLGADEWAMAHVHPSGDPRPSQEDIDTTERLATASALVGVRLVGHVVVTHGGKWQSVTNRASYGELDRVQMAGPDVAAHEPADVVERPHLELD
jgi:DNA repair protein RadC